MSKRDIETPGWAEFSDSESPGLLNGPDERGRGGGEMYGSSPYTYGGGPPGSMGDSRGESISSIDTMPSTEEIKEWAIRAKLKALLPRQKKKLSRRIKKVKAKLKKLYAQSSGDQLPYLTLKMSLALAGFIALEAFFVSNSAFYVVLFTQSMVQAFIYVAALLGIAIGMEIYASNFSDEREKLDGVLAKVFAGGAIGFLASLAFEFVTPMSDGGTQWMDWIINDWLIYWSQSALEITVSYKLLCKMKEWFNQAGILTSIKLAEEDVLRCLRDIEELENKEAQIAGEDAAYADQLMKAKITDKERRQAEAEKKAYRKAYQKQWHLAAYNTLNEE